MANNIGIRNVRYKPLNRLDIQDMQRLAIVNARYLRATINHLNAMINGLAGKKDEVQRTNYKTCLERAHLNLKEEEYWVTFYTKVLNKNHGKV